MGGGNIDNFPLTLKLCYSVPCCQYFLLKPYQAERDSSANMCSLANIPPRCLWLRKHWIIFVLILLALCFIMHTVRWIQKLQTEHEDEQPVAEALIYDKTIVPVYNHNQNGRCDFQVIQDYIRNEKYFPNKGKWLGDHQGSIVTFKPELCSLPTVKDNLKLTSCFPKNEIKRILMLGDSNGMRYYLAMRNILRRSLNLNCSIVKQEVVSSTNEPDGSYYIKGTNLSLNDIQTHERDATGSKSQLVYCKSNGGNDDIFGVFNDGIPTRHRGYHLAILLV